LERAEALKGIALPVTSPNTENVRGLNSIQEDSSPTDGNLCLHHLRQLKFKSAIFYQTDQTPDLPQSSSNRPSRPALHRGDSAHLVVTGQSSYTKEEKVVLERTSRINNNNFLPFMSVDLREQFRLNLPYTDKYRIR
jgi:hypothetical protein